MIKISQEKMCELSLSDCIVEKMEFSPKYKILKIFMLDGWILPNKMEVHPLGRGVLVFTDWDSISISRFNQEEGRMIPITDSFEPFREICEENFSESTVSLHGFGDQLGFWMEWKIVSPKMHAEFEKCKDENNPFLSPIKKKVHLKLEETRSLLNILNEVFVYVPEMKKSSVLLNLINKIENKKNCNEMILYLDYLEMDFLIRSISVILEEIEESELETRLSVKKINAEEIKKKLIHVVTTPTK